MKRLIVNLSISVVATLLICSCTDNENNEAPIDGDIDNLEFDQEEAAVDGDNDFQENGDREFADDHENPIPDVTVNGIYVFNQDTDQLAIEKTDQIVVLDLVLMIPEISERMPLVVFTHGFSASPDMYLSYGERLASWGFVVIMPQMPGGFSNPETHQDQADYLAALLDWATDSENVKLSGKVDESLIGLAGHSMGGKLSFLLASQDPRPKAIFGVDPVDSAPPIDHEPEDYPSVTPEKMPDISIPFVALGETVNGGEGSLSCAPSAENFQQYYTYAESPAIQIDVLGANHMSFVDDPDCGLACAICPKGTDDPFVTRMLTQKYMTAFFLAVLNGQTELYDYLIGDCMQQDVDTRLVEMTAKNEFGVGQSHLQSRWRP